MLQPSPLSPYPQLIRTPDPAIATFLHDKWAFFAVSHVKCPIQLPTHWLSSSSHKQPHLLLPHSRVIYAESEKTNAKNYIYLKSYRKFFAEETPDTIQRATILPTIKLPSSWHEIYDKKAHSNKTNAKEKLWFFCVQLMGEDVNRGSVFCGSRWDQSVGETVRAEIGRMARLDGGKKSGQSQPRNLSLVTKWCKG